MQRDPFKNAVKRTAIQIRNRATRRPTRTRHAVPTSAARWRWRRSRALQLFETLEIDHFANRQIKHTHMPRHQHHRSANRSNQDIVMRLQPPTHPPPAGDREQNADAGDSNQNVRAESLRSENFVVRIASSSGQCKSTPSIIAEAGAAKMRQN
jgi:hypothetical protein